MFFQELRDQGLSLLSRFQLYRKSKLYYFAGVWEYIPLNLEAFGPKMPLPLKCSLTQMAHVLWSSD